MHGPPRRPSLQGMRWKPWNARTERLTSLMDKRFQRIFWRMRIIRQLHISCLGDHRDSQLPWKLPRQGQVQLEDQGARRRGGAHLVRDLRRCQGRFLEGEHQELWFYEYDSNPLISGQEGDRKTLWNIRRGNWRDPPCHQRGQDSEGPVQVQQEEERGWLQMPG